MSAPICTGSDVIVGIVRNAGGLLSRADALRAATDVRGRRQAGLDIATSLILGRVELVILLDGRPGLRLAADA